MSLLIARGILSFVEGDSNAILVYLALKYDKTGKLYPVSDPLQVAQVQKWLSIGSNEMFSGYDCSDACVMSFSSSMFRQTMCSTSPLSKVHQ